MEKTKDQIAQFWQAFLLSNPDNLRKEIPEAFYFCDNKEDADVCADLVVRGIKQATAPSLWWFEQNNETLPQIGDQFIVTDWDGQPKAVIETIKVEQVPYNKITPEFAATEGEGDKSLRYWKEVHEAYYRREMEPAGASFSEDMNIVCEYFKTIYTE